MIIKYFDYVSVSLMTNRDLLDTYEHCERKGDPIVKRMILLREIAARGRCSNYLSDNPSSEVIEEVLDIFSNGRLKDAKDEIY